MSEIQSAIEAIKAKRLAEAETILAQILAKTPDHAHAWLWLAETKSSPSEKLAVLCRAPESVQANAIVHKAISALKRLQRDQKSAPAVASPTRARLFAAPPNVQQAVRPPAGLHRDNGSTVPEADVTPAREMRRCPNCAEEILVDAAVCQFCQRPVTAATAEATLLERRIAATIAHYTQQGYVVVHRGTDTVQLRQPKRFNAGCLTAFVILPFVLGLPLLFVGWGVLLIGFAILALVALTLSYLADSDHVIFFTREQLLAGSKAPKAGAPPHKASPTGQKQTGRVNWGLLVVAGIVGIAALGMVANLMRPTRPTSAFNPTPTASIAPAPLDDFTRSEFCRHYGCREYDTLPDEAGTQHFFETNTRGMEASVVVADDGQLVRFSLSIQAEDIERLDGGRERITWPGDRSWIIERFVAAVPGWTVGSEAVSDYLDLHLDQRPERLCEGVALQSATLSLVTGRVLPYKQVVSITPDTACGR